MGGGGGWQLVGVFARVWGPLVLRIHVFLPFKIGRQAGCIGLVCFVTGCVGRFPSCILSSGCLFVCGGGVAAGQALTGRVGQTGCTNSMRGRGGAALMIPHESEVCVGC